MTRKIKPVRKTSWVETLRMIKQGATVMIEADYRETNGLRSRASQMKKQGYLFSVTKNNEKITQVTRIK